MALSVKMEANPALTSNGQVDKKAPKCIPERDALLENPIRMKFFHLQVDPFPKRKPLFHENDIVKRVRLMPFSSFLC